VIIMGIVYCFNALYSVHSFNSGNTYYTILQELKLSLYEPEKMTRSTIAWFSMWMSWYIVILPAVHSEEGQ
jgi:hypothetical protein